MGPRRDGAQRREVILDAALECFLARGLFATTIADIRARSGASPSSLYHHFGGLEQIALALLRRSFERLFEELLIAVRATRGAKAGVEALVSRYLRWIQEAPQEARFIYQISGGGLSKAASEELASFKSELYAPLLAHFLPHVQSGAMPSLPAPMYDVVIMGPAHEFGRRYLGGAPGLKLEDAQRVLPGAAWSAIRSVARGPKSSKAQ